MRRRKRKSFRNSRNGLMVFLTIFMIGTGAAVISELSDSFTSHADNDNASSYSSNSETLQEPAEYSPPTPDSTITDNKDDSISISISRFSRDDWRLILVNKENLLPGGFEIELVQIQGQYRMDHRVGAIIDEMIAAAKADGVNLLVCSAYRTVTKQQELFDAETDRLMNNGLSRNEAERITATAIAVPGTSEHHTGLAADIVTLSYQMLDEGFDKTDAFKWLDQHAHEYGFIMRYPKDKQHITNIIYEPWHYRYVGIEAAEIIKQNNLTLEEFILEYCS